MKRRGMTLVELVVVIVIMNVLLAILLPVFSRTHCGDGRRSSCQLNIRQIGLGIKQYLADYDERFPLIAVVNSPTYGWADAVQPYVRATQFFYCPSEVIENRTVIRPSRRGYTDYWYNAHLSTLYGGDVWPVSRVFLLGDGNDGQDLNDARYVRYGLSHDWYTDEKKPSFRHGGGANYGFADGHVKWLKADAVTTEIPASTHFTFVPRS